MSYKQTPRSSFTHNNRRLQYSYINNPNVSCREYTHYIANMTKVRKKITFRKNELLNRLYNTSLNKYKNERIKELQKKYAINSTKKKKVNTDRSCRSHINKLFEWSILKREDKKKQRYADFVNATDEFDNQQLSKTPSFSSFNSYCSN